jgi:hypothetical protein
MAKKKTKKKTKKKPVAVKKTDSIKETVPAVGQAAAGLKKTQPTLTPMPTAGRKVQEFEDRLDKQLAGSGGAEKRGRGRPRKEAGPQPVEIDITVIGQAIQIPFDLWSVSQDVPDLKISIEESVMIAKPLKQLLDHYMPNVPEIAWAWISLSAVSYSIVKSRLVLIAEIKKAKKSNSSEVRKDAARGPVSPQGQGGPHPSAKFPSIDTIKKPAT